MVTRASRKDLPAQAGVWVCTHRSSALLATKEDGS